MHLQFATREHSNDINRKNERLFNRLQEIHAVSKVKRYMRGASVSHLCYF